LLSISNPAARDAGLIHQSMALSVKAGDPEDGGERGGRDKAASWILRRVHS